MINPPGTTGEGVGEAYRTRVYSKDVPFIENILADEFIATYDHGSRGDKAKELALARSSDRQQ